MAKSALSKTVRAWLLAKAKDDLREAKEGLRQSRQSEAHYRPRANENPPLWGDEHRQAKRDVAADKKLVETLHRVVEELS